MSRPHGPVVFPEPEADMIANQLLLAATSLATWLTDGALGGALGGGALGREQQQQQLRYYHCDYATGVEFFVADTPLMPAYRCVSGRVQLLLASQDFRAPYSNTEWIEELDVQLSDDILTQVFPGSFHYVRGSAHRPVHGLEFRNPSVAINGLTVLNAARHLQADWVDEFADEFEDGVVEVA